MLFFTVSCHKEKKEIIITNHDYGWFVIIYNIKTAEELQISDGTIVLDFSKGHVIETSSLPVSGNYELSVVGIDKYSGKKNLKNDSYSIYPSRYVEEIIDGKFVSYHEFYYGNRDGSGDARSLVIEHLQKHHTVRVPAGENRLK